MANRIIYIMLLLTNVLCYSSIYTQNVNSADYNINYHPWSKSVINKNKIYSFIPYIISSDIKNEHDLYPSIILSLQSNNLEDIDYETTQLTGIERCVSYTKNRFTNAFIHYSSYHPLTWDINKEEKLFYNDLTEGSGEEIFIRLEHKEKIKKKDSGIYRGIGSKTIFYNKVYRRDLKKDFVITTDEKGKEVFTKKPFDPREGIIFSLDTNIDDSINIYLLNEEQVLVWKVDYSQAAEKDNKPWEFLYAFKVPITRQFKICRNENDLFVLLKDTGIYKIDIAKATKDAPEPPKDVILDYGSKKTLVWKGFTQEHIVENEVRAEKVSNLKYDYYVVDKDNNTGYVIADNYLYELGNFKIRVKIPELRETETFLDKQAERMRAVLEAIYLLKRNKYEFTPKNLLEITEDKESEPETPANPDANQADSANPNTENNLDENADDAANAENSANSDSNKTNNQIADDADDSDISDDSENEPETSANAKNKSKSSSSSDSDIFIILGISASLIVLLLFVSLIIIPKVRKHICQ